MHLRTLKTPPSPPMPLIFLKLYIVAAIPHCPGQRIHEQRLPCRQLPSTVRQTQMEGHYQLGAVLGSGRRYEEACLRRQHQLGLVIRCTRAVGLRSTGCCPGTLAREGHSRAGAGLRPAYVDNDQLAVGSHPYDLTAAGNGAVPVVCAVQARRQHSHSDGLRV